MTSPNEIKCSDRELALFGLVLKELNQEEKPIINRLKILQVHYNQIAGGIAIGKIWKLILEGKHNTKTLKMQIDHMWPTQIEAHADLLRRAIAATRFVDTQWGLSAVDMDFEIKSFLEITQEWVKNYNMIGKLKIPEDEMHAKWRKSCSDHLAKLNNIYGTVAGKTDLVGDMLKHLRNKT